MNAITFDHKRFAVLADCLAVALAASLPWSTSATAIIAGLWLLAYHSNTRCAVVSARPVYPSRRTTGIIGNARWAGNAVGGCVVGGTLRWHRFVYQVSVHTFASVQVLSVRSWTASAARLCRILRCIASRLVGPLAVARVALAHSRQIPGHSGQRLYFAERNVHDLRLGHYAICIRYVANQPPPVGGGALHPRLGLSGKRVLRRNKPNLSGRHSCFAGCVWLSGVRLERGVFVGCRNYRTGDGSMALGFVPAAAGQFIL